ncbi:MAG: hypothetical protein AAB774_00110 [Patescibacteria group bacterium]
MSVEEGSQNPEIKFSNSVNSDETTEGKVFDEVVRQKALEGYNAQLIFLRNGRYREDQERFEKLISVAQEYGLVLDADTGLFVRKDTN